MITNEVRHRVGFHHYFPFGKEWTIGDLTQEGERMKFTGHERDADVADATSTSGLDYMHARYYSAGWGRFLSVDPGGFDPRKPQSWNRYAYALNNPVNALDPDGRETLMLVDGYRYDNPIGHVAIAINGRVYSYGTFRTGGRGDWGVNQQAYVGAESGIRETIVATLNVSGSEEATLQAHLEANNPYAPGAPTYDDLQNSCVTVSENALTAAGVLHNNPGPVVVDRAGNELQAGAPKSITLRGLLGQAESQGRVSSTTTVGTPPKESWFKLKFPLRITEETNVFMKIGSFRDA